MNSFQAAAFSFATQDPSRMWAKFGMPSLKLDTLFEAQRKNAAALASANQAAFEGFASLAQHQGDLLKTTIEDYRKAVSDVLAAASFEDRARMQADATRHLYDTTLSRLRQGFDIATRANVTAADILSARFTEALDELKTLFAAPAERAAEPRAVEVPVLAEAEPVAAEAEEAEAEAPIEPGSTDAPAPPAGRPTGRSPRTARRPTSR